MAFWGWCCGGRLGTSAAELTREEVVDLFTLSTQVNEGRLIVHGLFARADTKNTNGRIYPKPILRREVARFKAAHVSCGSALGELNHPSYYSAYFRSLNLPNVSHQVLEVHWRGNELWGTIEVLPTPAGLLLWELYSRGIKLGVSSRGWASVVADPANNRVLVDDDFQLITFDFVTEPSNAGAYLVPIRTKYKKPLPDQLRAVRAAYLGFGSTDMANVAQLPAASVLSKWLKSTKKSMAAAAAQYSTGGAYEQAFALTAAALQQPPAAAAIGCGSDNTAATSSYIAIDSCLDSLDVIADAESAGKLLRRLPSLRQLQTDRLFSRLRSYTEVPQLAGPLEQQLASLTRLTSLCLSSGDLQHLGYLKWAHRVMREASRRGSSSSSSSSSSRLSKYYRDEYAGLACDSRHLVYWLPDWLAAAPGLTSLAIKPPKHSSSSSSSNSSSSSSSSKYSSGSSTPACLWMSAAPWSSKLESLDIQGVPLAAWLPPPIPQLTRLRCLRLHSCSLQPRAAAALVRQAGAGCKALQVLNLSGNELWQLPSEGWEGLAGLKELDLSHNALVSLPGAISSLASLTALRLSHNQLSSLPEELAALRSLVLFDASHNWLSGLRASVGASLASLAAAWPHLQSLALANTSDKHGSLALPQELAGCSRLQELRLGSNYDLDWGSLQVLQQCTALLMLDLGGMRKAAAAAAPPDISQLLAQLQPRVAVQWD
ncbi:hypothetical protein OEZ86_011538 [Tetradesmus obliquus]|nr:hypothetical protein OEZ86_011538 [Tetradesmus obliquus]